MTEGGGGGNVPSAPPVVVLPKSSLVSQKCVHMGVRVEERDVCILISGLKKSSLLI